MRCNFLLLLLFTVGCQPSRATIPDPAAEASGVEAAKISVIDIGSRTQASVTQVLLKPSALDERQRKTIAELQALAAAHFEERRWNNYGPDSRFREITLPAPGGSFVLRSWHPIYERNPQVVASSGGLTAWSGGSRNEFLQQDCPTYLARRNAFDTIYRGLQEISAATQATPIPSGSH